MAVWNIDPSHTNVTFSVKHMMVSKVRGEFQGFGGKIEGNPEDLANANVSFTIETASINTNNEDRDNHLRSADFFDAENNPQITFTTTSIKQIDEDEFDVIGDMTLNGVTKPVTFKTEYTGKGVNPWGVDVVGFEASTKISRKEFNLTWNQALETGGVLVGDQIKIEIELQANPA